MATCSIPSVIALNMEESAKVSSNIRRKTSFNTQKNGTKKTRKGKKKRILRRNPREKVSKRTNYRHTSEKSHKTLENRSNTGSRGTFPITLYQKHRGVTYQKETVVLSERKIFRSFNLDPVHWDNL